MGSPAGVAGAMSSAGGADVLATASLPIAAVPLLGTAMSLPDIVAPAAGTFCSSGVPATCAKAAVEAAIRPILARVTKRIAKLPR